MNNDSPLEFAAWCKSEGISVFDMGSEGYYQEYLEDFIFDIRISGVEKNGDLRVEIENGKHKNHLAWYTKKQ